MGHQSQHKTQCDMILPLCNPGHCYPVQNGPVFSVLFRVKGEGLLVAPQGSLWPAPVLLPLTSVSRPSFPSPDVCTCCSLGKVLPSNTFLVLSLPVLQSIIIFSVMTSLIMFTINHSLSGNFLNPSVVLLPSVILSTTSFYLLSTSPTHQGLVGFVHCNIPTC